MSGWQHQHTKIEQKKVGEGFGFGPNFSAYLCVLKTEGQDVITNS